MISTLAVLKKKMVERPYLYEAEEHAVLKLAEDAVTYIRELSDVKGDIDETGAREAAIWLKEHE